MNQAKYHALQASADRCPYKAQVLLGLFQMLASCNGKYESIQFIGLNDNTKTHLFMAMQKYQGLPKTDKTSFVEKLKEHQTHLDDLVKTWKNRNKQSTPTKVKEVALGKLIFYIALGATLGFAIIRIADYIHDAMQDCAPVVTAPTKAVQTWGTFSFKMLRHVPTMVQSAPKRVEYFIRIQWMMSAFMGWICGCEYLRRK